MPHLADTNILTRFTSVNDPQHPLVSDAVRALLLQGETLYYTQQNRREFWNICTRPAAANGLGYTVAETLPGSSRGTRAMASPEEPRPE